MLSNNNASNINNYQINEELLEKVILGNDLSSLNSLDKVNYVKNICNTLGLNPVTKPIQIMKFQGKEIPYFTKDSTEQLRKINKVSITKIDSKILEGGIYVVTASANTPDGRQDSSTGVISISGLKGDALSNAMMKAETKSKRRVTLSICGLGFIDECEVESIPNAKKMEIVDANLVEDKHDLHLKFIDNLYEVEHAVDISFLQNIFNKCIKDFKGHSDLLNQLISAKDIRKSQLLAKEMGTVIDDVFNENTGEIK